MRGVYPVLELMQSLNQGALPERIRNLWIKKDNRVIENELRPLKEDMDLLPFADRALFRENTKGGNPHNMIMVASRGCHFDCSYCFSHAFRNLHKNQHVAARRTVPSVIKEIQECKSKYDIQFISFCDSIFTLDADWLKEFATQYSDKIKLPFYCNVHPVYVDEQRVQLLSLAGCSVVGMGIECGDENVRFGVLNRPITDKKILEASGLIKKYKIKIASGNILAIPNTNLEADLKTLRLNIKCKVNFPEIFIMSLHPGTDIYKQHSQNLSQLNGEQNMSIPTLNSLGVFYANTKKFSSAMEKRMIMNLQNLFGIIVALPFLYPLTRFLIRLPLSKFYCLLFTVFESLKTFTYKRNHKNLLRRILIQAAIIKQRFKSYESFNTYK